MSYVPDDDYKRSAALDDFSKTGNEKIAKVKAKRRGNGLDTTVKNGPRYHSESLADVIADVTAERWLIHGVLILAGLMTIFGPSGSAKSFLVLSMMMALAIGSGDWYGHRVSRAPVLYVALEGERGIRRRLLAWQKETGLPLPDNFRMLRRQPLDLRRLQDVADLIELVKADGIRDGVIVVDTLNRASPGADENSSAEVSILIEACDAIRRATGCAVILVAHSGKDTSKGLRGHSSMFAALDTAVECIGTTDPREWVLVKAKDEQSGERHGFEVASIELGTDADGLPVSGGVAVPTRYVPGDPVEHVKPPTTANQKLAYQTIGALLRESKDFGRAGAAPTYPCVRFETAVEALAAKLIQYELKKRTWEAKRVISAMQTKWYATDGEWLWHK